MALKKAQRRIVVSDESVNSNGFWILSSGVDRTMYDQNPIMLWNHNRPRTDSARTDEVLPIGIITELSIDSNGVMTGLPAFDDTDPFALKICEKYDAGILNMASIGVEPVEVLTDQAHLKNGAPCLAKSRLAEISLTDIGSNRNAVKLYMADKAVQLSSADDLITLFFKPDNNPTMLLKLKDFADLLKLSAEATENDIFEALKKQNAEILTLTTAKKAAEDALAALQKKVNDDKIVSLVDGAIDSKKITAKDRDKYITLAQGNYDTVKSLIDGMTPYESIKKELSSDDNSANAVELAELLKLSNDQLFDQGKFDRLKTLSEVHYKLKYKEYFGVDPK